MLLKSGNIIGIYKIVIRTFRYQYRNVWRCYNDVSTSIQGRFYVATALWRQTRSVFIRSYISAFGFVQTCFYLLSHLYFHTDTPFEKMPSGMRQRATDSKGIHAMVIGMFCLINGFTKTRLFKSIENFATQNWKFSDKTSDIFHISAQNIDCGYSLEPPRQGGSNEYHNLWFLAETRKNNVCLCWGFTAQSTQWGHVGRGQFT